MTVDHFLDHHYAANRPALLIAEMKGWPALERWTPTYRAKLIGGATIECQAGRTSNLRFELDKEAHRRTMAFDHFIARVAAPAAGNDFYLTAYNSGANRDAFAPLHAHLGRIDRLLDHSRAADEAMLWIGGAGSFTPLHHDLTNNLLAQVTGRKRVILVPPDETGRLLNRELMFSDLGDLLDPVTQARHPELHNLPLFDITLEAGTTLFTPVG